MLERDDHDLGFNTEQAGAEFDLLLRTSLETYADPGSNSGLAERVLTRIAVEGERERARRMSRWAIALPVAACLVIAIGLLGLKTLRNSEDRTNQARAIQPRSTDTGRGAPIENAPSVAARHNVVSRPMRHSSGTQIAQSAKRLPKLDVFPAPQPLTREEQALVAYVAHVPETERKSLVEEQKQMDAPLTIAALEIQPLEPPEPQGN